MMTRYIVRDGAKVIGTVTVPTQRQTGGTRVVAERYAKEVFTGRFLFVTPYINARKADQREAERVGVEHRLDDAEETKSRFGVFSERAMSRYIVREGYTILGIVAIPQQTRGGISRNLAEAKAQKLFPDKLLNLSAYSKAKKSERAMADKIGEIKE